MVERLSDPTQITGAQPPPPRGRGASDNPANRFEALASFKDLDAFDPEEPDPKTQFLKDSSRTAIAYNDSPDIGFRASLNPYRGCEHGCIYCYARPTHEYLGFSAGLDFETKILVKEEAPELLRRELSNRNWKPQVIAMSGVTDCYQPVERRLQLTRRCLGVLADYLNPVMLITKNRLITRDIDHLQKLAEVQAVAVIITITSLRGELTQTLEPRAAHPTARLEAIRQLAAAGIPTGVHIAPIIPGLTDYETPAILKEARQAGACFAGFTILRLPFGVAPLFEQWLEQHAPESKQKILNRIRQLRGGRLNDARFQSRMRGEGALARQIASLFKIARRKVGFPDQGPILSAASFRKPSGTQLTLF